MKNLVLIFAAIVVAPGCHYNARNFVTDGHPEPKFVVHRNVKTTVVMSDGFHRRFQDVWISGDSVHGWTQARDSGKPDSTAISLHFVKRIEQRSPSVLLTIVAVLSVISALLLALLGLALASVN